MRDDADESKAAESTWTGPVVVPPHDAGAAADAAAAESDPADGGVGMGSGAADGEAAASRTARDADAAAGPEDERAEVQRLADEGMLIAESALRMRVKNRIVMQVMGRGEPLTPQDCRDYIVEEADALIAETRASAKYLDDTYEEVDRFGFGGPKGTYGRDDLKSLDLRQQVDEELVDRLTAGRNDPAYRTAIADEARTQAMNEMFRARMMPPPRGPALTPEERAEEMRAVSRKLVADLAEHIEEQRRLARIERRREQRRALLRRLRFWER